LDLELSGSVVDPEVCEDIVLQASFVAWELTPSGATLQLDLCPCGNDCAEEDPLSLALEVVQDGETIHGDALSIQQELECVDLYVERRMILLTTGLVPEGSGSECQVVSAAVSMAENPQWPPVWMASRRPASTSYLNEPWEPIVPPPAADALTMSAPVVCPYNEGICWESRLEADSESDAIDLMAGEWSVLLVPDFQGGQGPIPDGYRIQSVDNLHSDHGEIEVHGVPYGSLSWYARAGILIP
jgi:hypothetical protein